MVKDMKILSKEQQASEKLSKEMEEVKEENNELKLAIQGIREREQLKDEGIFRQELLSTMIKIAEQLNSISQQLYDLNKMQQSKAQ